MGYLLTRNTRSVRIASLLQTLTIGLAMAVSAPVYSATKTKPYAEFIRALNIIEKTQLTIFTDSEPVPKETAIKEFEQQLELAKAEMDADASDYKQKLEDKRIDIMRQVLSKRMEQYNDQYANYIYPDSLKRYQSRRNGKFVGVGLKFRVVENNYPIAVGALLGGPMDNKDIQPGDQLISVDNTRLFKLTTSEVVAALKGPEDSIAVLEVSRNGSNHKINVTRSDVELHYADAQIIASNIGYIKISRFGSGTHTRVKKFVTDLIQKGAESFILDLRDNPGGSTRAARAIVSLFSKEQNMYCERYKTGATKQLPRHGEHVTDLPLAVLINGASMSSSEIVAGAIQTYNRGIIIGSPSFGKGLVQKVYNLKAPLGGAVRTTIAMFGRPDHKLIHGAGIVPDVYIESDSDFMFRRTGSLNISAEARDFQRGLLEQRVTKEQPERAKEFISAQDLQLQTAIDKLQNPVTDSNGE